MKRTFPIIAGVLLTLIVLLTSCTKDQAPEPSNVPDLRSISAEEQQVIASSNQFSLDLFARINNLHLNENVFISPFSISTALSMTLNGAEDETLNGMKKTLFLEGLSEEEINTSYRDLVAFLLQLDQNVNLEVANSNWYRDNLTIHPDFESVLLDYYDAEVKAADFSDPATLNLINGWIEDNTNGKIKEMLDKIPSNAIMYLINAIYFKADWKYQFDAGETETRNFYLMDGSAVTVPTMYSEGVEILYAVNEEVQLIDIPYGNGQFSFTILFPTENHTVNELAESLSSDDLNTLLMDTSSIAVELYLPKFKLEFKQLLNDVLIEMGMGRAFDGADFGRLFEDHTGAAISRVIHQSFLEVNEEGSEAAAATIVEIVETSGGPPSAIHIDRPFLFFIREKHSQTILFSGKLIDPGN